MSGSEYNGNMKYIRNLAKRALGTFSVEDDSSIEHVKKEFGENKTIFNKSNVIGLSIGVAIGVLVCTAASFTGVSFTNIESAFIIAQFGLLGGLMYYIYS